MKNFNLLIIGAVLSTGLVACNIGDDGSDATIANISISNNTCKTITKKGECSINVSYSAPSNSPVIQNQTFLQLTGLTGYGSNITQQCSSGAGYFTTTTKQCIITITDLTADVSKAQTGSLSPQGYANTSVTFTVGGGA